MANPPKPWKAEYAKSGRSSCKTCKSPIGKESLRLGKMVQATQFDGFMPLWNHGSCILKKKNQIKALDDVEGIEVLRWEDQQNIRKYLEAGPAGGPGESNSTSAPPKYEVDVSKTSRSTCKHCNQKIMKGQVRISSEPHSKGAKGLAWRHANCFFEISPTVPIEQLSGWDNLSASDQESVIGLVKKGSSSGTSLKVEEDEEILQKPSSTGGTKRKRATKDEKNCSTSRNGQPETCDLASQLETQTKQIWALKDDLKKNVSTTELREMLEANDQLSTGSELDLRDRCADGMAFGALEQCPLCSGHLQYSGGMYKCQGFISAWSKCAYSTFEPARMKEKWKIPDETTNQYLSKWFKSQKVTKPCRVLPPLSSNTPSGNKNDDGQRQSYGSNKLGDLRISMLGFPKASMDSWKSKIVEAGGQVHARINKDTNCLVVGEMLGGESNDMKKARKMHIPVVREEYLIDCFEKQKKLRFDLYKTEAIGESSSMVTIKVKGRSAVHESSGLQDICHILEDGKNIYNTTLSMSDLSTGINSYYILQIIQEDKGSSCYVFRKWGRVGNEKIGGKKLDNMSKMDAIQEFKRLFLEKTGNPWEAWVEKEDFQKQPGKFYPLDIDYGINKDPPKKKILDNVDSILPHPLLELMKMLFNVEAYRAAMMEFEINMAEMPLGKLSKSNIQKGYEALTEIQNLLSSLTHEPHMRESLIVDASNRFFTMIPSIHPHVINDEDDFKSKVKMLDALQDIEIASRLVGFDGDNDDSLDEKYRKLQCNIEPLPHNSEDYRLVEKYLHKTHAPTHTGWTLELEDVFSLAREGESNKFTPYKGKLKNRMLLWHGSRLTNFVGILSQGLRIAPPEAPATGYMFGKGVYFADLVSKSAQYCFTDKKNPVGLMLLSEVALGEVYELTKAKYVEKLPSGKHSTKGLGKIVPQKSEFVTWKDEVVVPCGKPVQSNTKSSELMYNEYIVYDTTQVKMQFLLKVRFHHK
ncbi:poly [ADP-ribose] polymerase 1 [Impatiens glandulifera]|uniref:poly [ADP-ribose] polymerase 1 n=1 Tax=Impatiens glandulifera TaxID=253017 RepID=UPI001FB062C7|nr:poly [ADP-ribose] polymerase 1 [Impatiens glandulifera]